MIINIVLLFSLFSQNYLDDRTLLTKENRSKSYDLLLILMSILFI